MAVHPMPRKAKEWSPIDRMLASRRSSKSASQKPNALQALSTDLPPLSQATNHDGVASGPVMASTQTPSWQELLNDAMMPDRERITALQAEVKAMRAQLRDREQDSRCLEIREQEEARRLAEVRSAYKAELDALHQQHTECMAEACAQQLASQNRCATLQDQVEKMQVASLRDGDEMGSLQHALGEKQREIASLKNQSANLQDKLTAVSKERKHLLSRLEVEQPAIIARVNAMERQMELRSSKILQ